MRVGFFNANGLQGKGECILQFQRNRNLDVMVIVETWLRQEQSSVILQPFMTMSQRADRLIMGGRRAVGGILVFGNEDFRKEINIMYEDNENNYFIVTI